MQDRIPTKPNRYAVYDDEHNFVRYEYHERADEPTQTGDALNKDNLLPDDVAAVLSLTGNPQVKDALLALRQWRLIQIYDKAGAYTFNVPGSNLKQLGVLVIGGGGSGAAGYTTASVTTVVFRAYGGNSGGSAFTIIDKDDLLSSYPVIVGSGGAPVTPLNQNSQSIGNVGGTSSFNGVIAEGGYSGGFSSRNGAGNDYGGTHTLTHGQGATRGTSQNADGVRNEPTPAFGKIMYSTYDNVEAITAECVNPFDGMPILMAGGSVRGGWDNTDGYITKKQTEVFDVYGNHSSVGVSSGVSSVTATKGTAWGCGGAGATTVNTKVATSAAGADGAVLIYAKY